LRSAELKERLERLSHLNSLRCSRFALYGSDLIDVSDLRRHPRNLTRSSTLLEPAFNQGRGHFDCLFHLNEQTYSRNDWNVNALLRNLLKTNHERAVEMDPILERFAFLTPRVAAPSIKMHVSHPCPSKKLVQEVHEERIRTELAPCSTVLHRVVTNMSTQFPELRLIQYDCGKLQTLDRLLWQLKAGGHRALIFTQMSRMLDIFEQFLNYHGHTYLRLDGTTRIEQRQSLMERFNADKRIFCFILSTRSGGVGVNLTGADTVIFYDSDWNPTMDAQAQDRCHRIGQTRDVHIYRLISEKTIEENILKKARQKKFLGDVAIEGGNFTTAFFRNDSIRELFAVNEKRDERPLEEVRLLSTKESNEEPVEVVDKGRKMDLQLGQALQTAEEDTDVAAAKVAAAEADAEFAEFDENIPLENADRLDEKSPEEEELDRLVYQV
jgi:E1A-binding protein p400